MSIHPSLRGVDTLIGDRSVWSRIERIQHLTKNSKFDEEEDSVFGLPKVRTKFKGVGKKKKEAADEAAGTNGEEAGGEASAAS